MGFEELRSRIRIRETPFYDGLYRFAKRVRGIEVLYVPGWHDALYHERSFRINAWRTFWRVIYYQPMFRSRCARCGSNLHIYHSGQGLPYIAGDLEIVIGDGVSFYDRSTLVGLTVGERPRIVIGDNTDISQPITIIAGNEVHIGSNCLIGCSMISDNPGHNLVYDHRFQKLDRAKIGRIQIGDYVWAALQSVIAGNVSVGFGAVIGARTVVTKDVPPFCVVAGNPMRIVKKMEFPHEMISGLGEDAYERYQRAHIGAEPPLDP